MNNQDYLFIKKLCMNKQRFKNEIILNVFRTFFPNRMIAICDCDTAWLSENIKNLQVKKKPFMKIQRQ